MTADDRSHSLLAKPSKEAFVRLNLSAADKVSEAARSLKESRAADHPEIREIIEDLESLACRMRATIDRLGDPQQQTN